MFRLRLCLHVCVPCFMHIGKTSFLLSFLAPIQVHLILYSLYFCLLIKYIVYKGNNGIVKMESPAPSRERCTLSHLHEDINGVVLFYCKLIQWCCLSWYFLLAGGPFWTFGYLAIIYLETSYSKKKDTANYICHHCVLDFLIRNGSILFC